MEVFNIYDYLNGDQVRCFYSPMYYPEGIDDFGSKICYSGGSLRGYKTGEKVPYKTHFYKYTKNFIIMSYDRYYTKKSLIFHIIQDGIVSKTVNFNKLIDFDFKKIDCFIDYQGRKLNIKNIYNVSAFCKDSRRVQIQIEKATKNRHKMLDDMSLKAYEIRKLKENDEEIFNIINNNDVSELISLLNGLNIFNLEISNDNCLNILKENKEFILNNKLLYKKLIKLIENRLNIEFKHISEIYDIEFEASNKIIEPIRKKHTEKWFIEEEYILERTVGEYLDCLLHLSSMKYEEPDNEKYTREMNECISDFKEILNNNIDVTGKYLSWVEESDEFNKKVKEIICDICK